MLSKHAVPTGFNSYILRIKPSSWVDGVFQPVFRPDWFVNNLVTLDEGATFPVVKGGVLEQCSRFSSPFSRYYRDGHGPLLSTGKRERPVHHEAYSGLVFPRNIGGQPVMTYNYTSPEFDPQGPRPTSTQGMSYLVGNASGMLFAEFWSITSNSAGTSHHATWDANTGIFTVDVYQWSSNQLAWNTTSIITFQGGSKWQEEAVSWKGYTRSRSRTTKPSSLSSFGEADLPELTFPSLTRGGTSFDQWYASAYTEIGKSLANYDLNSLENLFSAADTAKLLSPMSWVPRSGMSILKWISSSYLAYSYGVRPTVSDAKTSLRLISDAASGGYLPKRIVGYSSASIDGMDLHLKISLKNPHGADQFNDLAARAASASMALDVSNLWDLVPYSFVVDWLLPIGDGLERLSAFNDTSRRWDFEYAVVSRKVSQTVSSGTFMGEVSTYDRCILDTPPSRIAALAAARGSGVNVTSALALAVNILT